MDKLVDKNLIKEAIHMIEDLYEIADSAMITDEQIDLLQALVEKKDELVQELVECLEQ